MKASLNIRGLELRLPAVMGVLNVTPDSFFDGGRYLDLSSALARLDEIAAQGAAIVDIGGQSSRPGSRNTAAPEEEADRVLPVVREARHRHPDLLVSVDTTRAQVALPALEQGAHIVNDITALRQCPEIADAVSRHDAGVVLMHMQGTPETMQVRPHYEDVVGEILSFLSERARFCLSRGIARERIFLDPGIGFGKTLEHNLALLRGLGRFAELGFPLLVGLSRKSFIGSLLDGAAPENRLSGSLAALSGAFSRGAAVFRVHDVRESLDALRVLSALEPEPLGAAR